MALGGIGIKIGRLLNDLDQVSVVYLFVHMADDKSEVQ